MDTYQTNHLHVSTLEFILQPGKCTELGGADRREVRGVGEKDGPAVTDELVEVDVTVGGLGIKVGGCNKQLIQSSMPAKSSVLSYQ